MLLPSSPAQPMIPGQEMLSLINKLGLPHLHWYNQDNLLTGSLRPMSQVSLGPVELIIITKNDGKMVIDNRSIIMD